MTKTDDKKANLKPEDVLNLTLDKINSRFKSADSKPVTADNLVDFVDSILTQLATMNDELQLTNSLLKRKL